MRAVRAVPGLMALLFFSTFNNFLGGVFMALMDPYGLELVSVEAWGIMLALTSSGFIIGGLVVARRGLGTNPAHTLLLVNVVMWTITILFPIRPSIIPLAIGFFFYMVVIPMARLRSKRSSRRSYRSRNRVGSSGSPKPSKPRPRRSRLFSSARSLRPG
ncbi:MAG: hypothetical protein ACR2NT_10860 [Acidimicrobiia bacterium]